METLDAVDSLQIAVLQQDLLENEIDVGEAKKRKMTAEDAENIRPVHSWQRRGEGSMDISPD